MPRLWSETVAEHRSAVLDAILDATAALVHRNGVTGLTMASLAEASGIGRATLYRYVPDVAAAIAAWQQREVGRHLQHLRTIALAAEPEDRLDKVLAAYARIRSQRHGDHGSLHDAGRLAPAEAEVRALVQEIITGDVSEGRARKDFSADELAVYAIGSLGAAGSLPTPATAEKLAALVVASIRAPEPGQGTEVTRRR